MKDCIICGAKGTVSYHKNIKKKLERNDCVVFVEGLSGEFCSECDDGFWDKASTLKIEEEMGKLL